MLIQLITSMTTYKLIGQSEAIVVDKVMENWLKLETKR